MSASEPKQFILAFDNEELLVETMDDLTRHWPALLKIPLIEAWLVSEDDCAMCVLKNKDRAWLMFLRHFGDAGFSSRRNEEGLSGNLEFRLTNGQIDSYPANWTIPTADALRAMEFFFEHGCRPPWIDWRDDSQ